ncbi:MAG: thymidylate kinase [Wendovervirus sonii]|uniref:Thymidylate kinase n=1 Tax=phage Lak_Megaphage_Sonny TaxID=3109229 RepID=A0ABZ0Z3B1_9CAUD|nr:MAG: thymidylate kinase [phage Lak_Megaphage_Sonny]
MNVIIFEGLDNTGKTTQINMAKEYFEKKGKRVMVTHFNMPPENMSNEQKAAYQNNEYINYVKKLIQYKKDNIYDIVLIDRCWYSEYVYGQMYRGRDSFELLMYIKQLEDYLLRNLNPDNVTLLMFTVHSLEFAVSHEDGKSISEGKLDLIKKEKELFDDIFSMSDIEYKNTIYVDSLINKGHFKYIDEIFDDIKYALW